nr:MAG TPA: tail tape measure [Caudoviricetes sp.]
MESYSVTAVLSAKDSLSPKLKGVAGLLNSTGGMVKAGLGFGALSRIGGSAVASLGRNIKGLVNEINETNATWKTFTANMQMSGMGKAQINRTKKDLQNFAAKTIYSSKDMASTYAQLYAVNKKTTTGVVKGFGAVAAASENPRQAMKTLSTQATQMAAKPKVAWQDFKLMLEQSPAGLSRVATKMGMTTKELVANVQAGKVKTEDFFKAMEKAGNDKSLLAMAQQYKTVGEAAEGLRATLATRLAPAFDVISKAGVGAISGAMATLSSRLEIASNSFKGVGTAFSKAFSAVGKSIAKITNSKSAVDAFKKSMDGLARSAKGAAKFLEKHSDSVAYLVTHIPELVEAFIGLKIALKLAGKMKALGTASETVASALPKAGKAAGTTSKQMLASSKAFMAMGAGVLLMASGFWVMAQAAKTLAKAGPLAVGVFAGMAVGIGLLGVGLVVLSKNMAKMSAGKLNAMSTAFLAFGGAVVLCAAGMWILAQAAKTVSSGGGLAVGVLAGMAIAIGLLVVAFAKFGPALDTAIPAMLSFGAMVVLIGGGIWLAAKGIAAVVTAISGLVESVTGLIGALPIAAQYGMQAAAGIALVGVACVAAAIGTVALGVAMLAFGTMALGTGAMLVGAGAMALAGGVMFLMFGIMVGLAAVGVAVLSLALKAVNVSMRSIANNARASASALVTMVGSINIVKSGLSAIGSAASSAMNQLKSAFSNASAGAMSAGASVGSNFSNGLSSGLNSAVSVARSMSNTIRSILHSAGSGAYSAGVYIGAGLANGMASQLGRVRSIATTLSNAADVAIKKAQIIRSPSHKQFDNGAYIGQGLVNGIKSKINAVRSMSSQMANAFSPQMEMAGMSGNWGLNDEYNYSSQARYEVHVHSEIDGREVAYATVDDLTALQARNEKRDRRRKGRF